MIEHSNIIAALAVLGIRYSTIAREVQEREGIEVTSQYVSLCLRKYPNLRSGTKAQRAIARTAARLAKGRLDQFWPPTKQVSA